MDGDDRRSSQYGQPYPTPGSVRGAPGQSMGPPTTERFTTPSTPARTDIDRSSLTQSYLPGSYGYTYQAQPYTPTQMHSSSPMQGVEMQYSQSYIHDPTRQQQVQQTNPQHQQYPQYAQGSLLSHGQSQQMYDPLHGYQQRQSSSIDTLSGNFTVPAYMQQTEQSPVAVLPGSRQYLSSQSEQSSYASIPPSRSSISHTYSSAEYTMVEPPGQQESQTGSTSQAVLDEDMKSFEQQLRSTFETVIAGRLTDASERILQLTKWLVNSVPALEGFHHDDEANYDERLKIWQQLNLCWEALGQKQKDVTEDALRTRQPPPDILSVATMNRMVDDLVALCDQLEQYGLVDYEMGIWEEEITHIFTVCIDLLPQEESTSEGRTQRTTST